MKKYISYLIFLSAFLLLSSCSKLEENEGLKFSISYLEDLEENETENSIIQKQFKTLESSNIGFKNGTYWFKVVVDEDEIGQEIIFDLPESNIHEITVFQNAEIISTKALENTHFSLLVPFVSQNPVYFLKVSFYNEVYFPLQVRWYKESQLTEKYVFFYNGLYYGFVTVALILNIFFYFSLKDRVFIFYCFFLIAIILGVLAYDGLLQIVLPVSFSRYTSVITHFLITFFGFLFGYKFLSTNYYLPKSNTLGFSLLAVAICSYVLFFITQHYFFVALADTVSFFVLLHNWIVGIIIFKKHDFAKFFVIGYSLVLFSAALFIIPIDWGLNMYTTSLASIKFGSLFEVLILTYAITYRVTILQNENQQFRKEIQEYLRELNILNANDTNSTGQSIQSLIAEYHLSKREAEVLPLVFEGYTNQRIADELFVSLNTVKYHIRNIYQKLNISTKNEAIDLYVKISKVD